MIVKVTDTCPSESGVVASPSVKQVRVVGHEKPWSVSSVTAVHVWPPSVDTEKLASSAPPAS